MSYFNEKIHVYGCNQSILWSLLKDFQKFKNCQFRAASCLTLMLLVANLTNTK